MRRQVKQSGMRTLASNLNVGLRALTGHTRWLVFAGEWECEMVGTDDDEPRQSGEPAFVITNASQSRYNKLLPGSRVALAAGFGGLLLIMTLGGVDALRVLREIRREEDQVRTRFLFRNHVLNDMRSKIYLSGTYVRDYLLDPDPERAEGYRANLRQVQNDMEAALVSYIGQAEPGDSAQIWALRTELASYWDVIRPILSWNAEQRKAQGYVFLRDAVFPRRTATLDLAGRIGDINEQQLDAGNTRTVGLLVQFQTRLAMTLFATLALGLGMAAFSTRKILRLEAHAQTRYEEVEAARVELTNLSARLVQAQEAERRSLSRELHDEVGQTLSAALVELHNLSGALETRSAEDSRSRIEAVRSLVESTMRVIRNMSLLLRPPMLDDLGLVPALKWLAREVGKPSSMDVSVIADTVCDDLPDEYKTCIYRVVQEALRNCSRHSRANAVTVKVQQKPGALTFSIRDNGRGFDVTESRGLGLIGIGERVARLGGSLSIYSAAGEGTVLSVELPYSGASGGQQRPS